jgi:2-C-methyl-D-erythritol 4-phosphate cytidylyltransferase
MNANGIGGTAMANFGVILLAAGKSNRFKDREKKQFADLDGRSVWLHSLDLFSNRKDVAQILIVTDPEDDELFDRRYRANVAFISNAKLVKGGKERVDSVQNALTQCSGEIDLVAVHDTARPCLTKELVDKVFDAATQSGAAALGCPVADTLKRVEKGQIIETVPREGLWYIQTPQVFDKKLLGQAYAQRSRIQGPITDDAQLVEAIGHPVTMVESDFTNIKITTKKDLLLASAILKSRPKPKPEGFIHPFAEDRMWS